MKGVDSHQHVFWHGKNDAELIADMDEQGINHKLTSLKSNKAKEAANYYIQLLTRLRDQDVAKNVVSALFAERGKKQGLRWMQSLMLIRIVGSSLKIQQSHNLKLVGPFLLAKGTL